MKSRFPWSLLAIALAIALATQTVEAQIPVVVGGGPGQTPLKPAPASMPLSVQSTELQANESVWVGVVSRVGEMGFTVRVTAQANPKQGIRIEPQERSFKWDVNTGFRALENRWAANVGTNATAKVVVDATLLRPGAGVNVVAAETASLARLIVVRLSDLPPLPTPPTPAPPIGPGVQPVPVIYRNMSGRILTMTWAPDGGTFAIGGGPAHLWDSVKLTPRVGLNSQDGGHDFLQFSPNGKLLAGVSDDRFDRGGGILWNGETGTRLTTLPTFGAHTLAWSPDSKMLALLQHNAVGIFQMYDAYFATSGPLFATNAAGKAPPPRSFGLKMEEGDRAARSAVEAIVAVGWDSEGYLWTVSLAGYDRSKAITRWRVTPGTLNEKAKTEPVASAPLPLRVLLGGGDEGAPLIEPVNILGFSPDATLLVGTVLGLREANNGGGNNGGVNYTDCQLRVWDTATGQLKFRVAGANWNSKCIAFSPKNEAVAVGGDGGTVQIYDLREGKLRYSFAAHKKAIRGLAWAPDGKTLATSTEIPLHPSEKDAPPDGAVRFWNAENGAARLALHPLSDPATASSVVPKPTLPTPEWLVMVPDGRVDASPGAGPWLRWRVGETLWPWESYRDTLRTPDLAAKQLPAAFF